MVFTLPCIPGLYIVISDLIEFIYSGLYFTDMELNNFNEYIVVTTDRVKNHQFCCGAFLIPLSIPTSIMGILGLVKLILSLIYNNHLGKRKINRRTSLYISLRNI